MREPMPIAIPDMQVDFTEESRDHRLSRTKGATIPASEEMVGSQSGSEGATRETGFSFHVNLPFSVPSNFTLTLPPLNLGEHRVVFQPVRFT